MSSELKFVRCGFNGGTERESGRQCLSLKRCLASVIAVSLSIVCMVPAAYAQNIDDVSSSPNAVISEGGGNTVVAAPSARNVNVDDKTSEEANTSNGAPTPSESSNGATDNKADDSAEATAGNSTNDGAQTQAPNDASSQDAKNDSSNATDQSPAKANVQVAATALGGRDFEGQVTKEINGKTVMSWGIVDASLGACFTSVVGHR